MFLMISLRGDKKFGILISIFITVVNKLLLFITASLLITEVFAQLAFYAIVIHSFVIRLLVIKKFCQNFDVYRVTILGYAGKASKPSANAVSLLEGVTTYLSLQRGAINGLKKVANHWPNHLP